MRGGENGPFGLSGTPFILRVKFAADQRDGGDQVEPDQEGYAGADRAIHGVVARDVADVPGESGGGQQPEHGGQDGAWLDVPSTLPAEGSAIIKAGGYGRGRGESHYVPNDPAGPR